MVGCLVVFPAPHLWIADQVRNDGAPSNVTPHLHKLAKHM